MNISEIFKIIFWIPSIDSKKLSITTEEVEEYNFKNFKNSSHISTKKKSKTDEFSAQEYSQVPRDQDIFQNRHFVILW